MLALYTGDWDFVIASNIDLYWDGEFSIVGRPLQTAVLDGR